MAFTMSDLSEEERKRVAAVAEIDAVAAYALFVFFARGYYWTGWRWLRF